MKEVHWEMLPKLPKRDGNYLVSFTKDKKHSYVTIAYFFRKDRWSTAWYDTKTNFEEISNVFAWTGLPTPCKQIPRH